MRTLAVLKMIVPTMSMEDLNDGQYRNNKDYLKAHGLMWKCMDDEVFERVWNPLYAKSSVQSSAYKEDPAVQVWVRKELAALLSEISPLMDASIQKRGKTPWADMKFDPFQALLPDTPSSNPPRRK